MSDVSAASFWSAASSRGRSDGSENFFAWRNIRVKNGCAPVDVNGGLSSNFTNNSSTRGSGSHAATRSRRAIPSFAPASARRSRIAGFSSSLAFLAAAFQASFAFFLPPMWGTSTRPASETLRIATASSLLGDTRHRASKPASPASRSPSARARCALARSPLPEELSPAVPFAELDFAAAFGGATFAVLAGAAFADGAFAFADFATGDDFAGVGFAELLPVLSSATSRSVSTRGVCNDIPSLLVSLGSGAPPAN
jgi:hypothetical protein